MCSNTLEADGSFRGSRKHQLTRFVMYRTSAVGASDDFETVINEVAAGKVCSLRGSFSVPRICLEVFRAAAREQEVKADDQEANHLHFSCRVAALEAFGAAAGKACRIGSERPPQGMLYQPRKSRMLVLLTF